MRIVHRIKEVVVAGMWLVMATSCHWGGTTYHQYRSINEEGWQRTDTLGFELPSFSAQEEVEAFVNVRYTGRYPYRHLWLIVRNNVTDSLRWDTDTLCCALYDEQGRLLGEGLAGIYQAEIPVATWLSDGSGCAGVRISHGMDDDSLSGIMDVGIRIRK